MPPANADTGMIVFVGRFQNDDFVSRIDHAQQSGNHGFGNSAGDGDMPVGIDLLSVKPPALLRDGLAEAGLSPGHSILIPSAAHGLLGLGENFFRWIEIREPLCQQDRSLVKCITRDGADHGLLKIVKPVGSVGFHGRQFMRFAMIQSPPKLHPQRMAG